MPDSKTADELKALRKEITRIREEATGRLKALNEKSEEARQEWIRAENAEGLAKRLTKERNEARDLAVRRGQIQVDLSGEVAYLRKTLADAEFDRGEMLAFIKAQAAQKCGNSQPCPTHRGYYEADQFLEARSTYIPGAKKK